MATGIFLIATPRPPEVDTPGLLAPSHLTKIFSMKILFIHQAFPGQFKHLAPALAARGHQVHGLVLKNGKGGSWQGVRIIPYQLQRGTTKGVHPWASDFETKVIRGEAVFRVAEKLRARGYSPDVIIAHHGWGETLFLKEVWPETRLGIYCEFYYHTQGVDLDFDPEFQAQDSGEYCRVRLKNVNNLLNFEIADGAISPTLWQASTFPLPFRDRIAVIHDGIDTSIVKPNPEVKVTVNRRLTLSRENEIITFVNRNLEPYRGYHIFMRALPDILARRPHARVMIVGGDDVSYGAKPEDGKTWKQRFIDEVRPRISEGDWQRVHFLGKVPYTTFLALLQISSVHVYLTYPFVLSWSLLEAMSAGCAIVASNTEPLKEAIIDNETGRLVDFFDVDGLIAAISALLDDPMERQRLGNNARAFACSHYDLHNVCLPGQLEWVEQLATPEQREVL